MSWNGSYASALAAAIVMFAMTGGIQASEKAVKAVEHEHPAAPPRPADVSIAFPDTNIRDWRPDGQQALYLQDNRRHWYRATLFAPCTDLPFALRIAFETRGTDRLDKFSAIRVGHERCQFQDLVPSGEPPKSARKGKGAPKG